METLKMKFKLNGLEFEIEGGENTVKEEFDKFKSFISGEMLTKIVPPNGSETKLNAIPQNFDSIPDAVIEENDYPTIKDIIRLDLPKSEKHWCLIYAFYSSNFGEETFTSKDILNLYRESKRYTETRGKNFSTTFSALVKDKLIKGQNNDDYRITGEGVKLVKDILFGNMGKRTGSVKKSSSKNEHNDTTDVKPRRTKNNKVKSIPLERFDIHKDTNTIALEDFLLEKNPGKNVASNVLVIGYYITKIRGLDSFTEGHVDYAYRTLSLTGRPKHLRQIIINAKNNNDYFESTDDGKWKITRTGEIYVEEKMLNKK